MIVLMKENPREAQVQAVIRAATDWGLDVHRSSGVHRVVLGLVGDLSRARPTRLERMPGVERVILISQRPASFADEAARARPMAPLTIGIAGLGLIGGSWARALARYAPEHTVIGFDRRRLPGVKAAGAAAVCRADVVILALPVLAVVDFLKRHARDFRPGALVSDTGSTKRAVCRAAQRLPKGVSFIGGHPLAGGAGSREPDADLFLGRTYALTGRSPRLEALIRRVGGRVVLASPEQHDRVLAVTSHLPQMISTALALEGAALARRAPAAKALMGPAFRDMTRRAQADFAMWRDIGLTNADFIAPAAASFLKRLRGLDLARSPKAFAAAARFRKRLA